MPDRIIPQGRSGNTAAAENIPKEKPLTETQVFVCTYLRSGIGRYLRIVHKRYVRKPSLPQMPLLQRLLRL